MSEPTITLYELASHAGTGGPWFSPHCFRARLAFALKRVPISTVEVSARASSNRANSLSRFSSYAGGLSLPPPPLDRQTGRRPGHRFVRVPGLPRLLSRSPGLTTPSRARFAAPFVEQVDGSYLQGSFAITDWLEDSFPDRPSLYLPEAALPVDKASAEYRAARAAGSEASWEDWVRPLREPIEGLCELLIALCCC